MALIDSLRASLDKARAIPGLLGLRRYRVYLVARGWLGSRPGVGASFQGSQEITVSGSNPPLVTQVSQRDVVASNGLYQDQDLRIGPLTKTYSGSLGTGGITAANFDVGNVLTDLSGNPIPGTSTNIFFKITGDDHPVSGSLYKKVSQETVSPFTYYFVVRKTGERP